MMHLYNEAKSIAKEALEESDGCFETARDYINESCDSHEVAIYYGKAIQFYVDQNTDEGEAYLEGCGGIAQEGDTFGSIACRIAYATLYCAACEALEELESEGVES